MYFEKHLKYSLIISKIYIWKDYAMLRERRRCDTREFWGGDP
jgi:hypothetical protein